METKTDTGTLRVLPDPAETRALDSDEGPQTEMVPPIRLGRYLVLEELGRGGMGVVWTAYDPKLDRKVAIKLLKPSAHTSTRQARFIREAQALAKLNHPNIVTVHDVDTHEDQLYMAMEYVAGQTLEQWLCNRPQWREILHVFDQAGQGLAAAHAADITHRDFKPSNVLIAKDGRVKVLDFGLAKHIGRAGEFDDEDMDLDLEAVVSIEEIKPHAQDSDIMKVIESSPRGKLTKVGRIVGTPAYMAPEQYVPFGPHGISAQTDQFSFAVALYEALFEQLPFESHNLYETYENVREGRIHDPPRESSVPGWVLRVLRKALHSDPHQRYTSMAALLAALEADPARRRRRLLAYAGGMGLLGLAAFGVVQATAEDSEPQATPCQGAPEHIAGVWDAPARASVEQGLLATGRPFAADTAQRVTTSLDAYAGAWVAQHTEICEATQIHGEQSDALLDVRMTCLERRRGEFGALIDVLATAEEDTVALAVAAAAGLRRPEPCASAQPGAESEIPIEPTRRAEFLALQARLDDAKALLAAGRHADARDQAAATSKNAKTSGFHRMRAEALVTEGIAHQRLREPELAEQRLREGITTASEVADTHTELNGWNNLLYTTGVLLDQAERTEDLRFAAHNALLRAGSPQEQETTLELKTAAVLLKQNRLEEASQAGENALRIAIETSGSSSLQYTQALNNLGIVAAKQANWVQAERRLRESYELTQQLLGSSHPEVASRGMNLANVLIQYATTLEDPTPRNAAYDEAEGLYARVIQLREEDDGPQSKNVARTLANLGQLQRKREKWSEAEHSLDRALRLLRALPGVEEDLANTLTMLAKVERLKKDKNYKRAEELYREALQLQRDRYGDDHASVGATRLQLSRTLIAMGRHRMAISECKLAISIFESGSASLATESLRAAHAVMTEANKALGRRKEALEHEGIAQSLDRQMMTGAELEPLTATLSGD